MTSPHWSLVESAARLLEAHEREVVLGDLLEAGTPRWRALLEIFGLAVRRQTGLWATWRPWLAAFGVAVPSFYLLMGVSGSVSCTYVRLSHPQNVDWHWPTAHEGPLLLLCHVLLLVAWSWAAGFVVGSLSCRTIWASAVLCLYPLLVVSVHVEPLPKVCRFLFVLPAAMGLWHGLRGIRIQPFVAVALAIAVTVLMILAATSNALWVPNWGLLFPVWYLAATALRPGPEDRSNAWWSVHQAT